MRLIVVVYGITAIAVGLVMIIALPVAASWRVAAAATWTAINARQLHIIAAGYRRCRRIRLRAGGGAEIQSPDGCWCDATLLAGSIVLRNVAWLRFELQDGRRCAELIRRKKARNQNWRRLQVIWRHLGAGG